MKLCFFEGKQRNIFVYNLFICEYMECDNLINQKMFYVQFMFEIKKKFYEFKKKPIMHLQLNF